MKPKESHPPLKYKILKNLGVSYIKKFFKIIKGPIFVSIFFTRECNFNCEYCSTSKIHDSADISLKEWKVIIKSLYNEGCRFITIYGGEPTLRSDLGQLLKFCIDLKMFVHLVTNGSFLNQVLLKEFSSYGYFLLGISVDTLSKKSFSPKRYNPELVSLLQDIRISNNTQLDYCFHILVTTENISELISLIYILHNKLVCRFSIDPVHSASDVDQDFAYRSYCPELLLKAKQMNWLVKTIQNLKRNNVNIWSPNNYYYHMKKWYQGRYQWKCDAGDLYIAINNDGRVMLCEDVLTPITFKDYMKMSRKERIRTLRNYKFPYCNCFKPCYWNPSNFIKNPLNTLISQYRFK